jgi:threonine synthase
VKYVSTRGEAPVLEFGDVLLAGLATDGGLYVPDEWPAQPEVAAGASYVDAATAIMAPYVAPSLDPDTFAAMVTEAYATFGHPDVCPVRDLGGGLHLLELFWGPTIAFKDVALQLVGRLFDHELAARGERATIVVATSGDTGSAAIEACRGRSNLDIVVLHPADRVSDVQRRQMTTVHEPNVHNVAVDGTFDDCQDVVKTMFGDVAFRADVRLSAMNSINWARVMAQVVYYVTSARTVGAGEPVAFSVPTGNFGNVFAGWVARRTGTPISQLVVGSNSNDILTRWLATGVMEQTGVHPTISPSMDIQVSSNAERLLFELYERNAPMLADRMAELRAEGRVETGDTRLATVTEVFDGASFDDEAIRAEIRRTFDETGVVIDPHTAVGVAAARVARRDPDIPVICLATAHPAKFPDAVESAIGQRPELPTHLADLFDREEFYDRLPLDQAVLQSYVRNAVGA